MAHLRERGPRGEVATSDLLELKMPLLRLRNQSSRLDSAPEDNPAGVFEGQRLMIEGVVSHCYVSAKRPGRGCLSFVICAYSCEVDGVQKIEYGGAGN